MREITAKQPLNLNENIKCGELNYKYTLVLKVKFYYGKYFLDVLVQHKFHNKLFSLNTIYLINTVINIKHFLK